MLNRQGYNTLALDLRAHGDSEGEYCTYGYYEKYDVQRALDYLLTKGVDSNIGVWGQSLGGAIALQTLAIEPRLKFGIIESTFSEFTTIVDDYSERMFGFSIPFVNQYALYRASEIANFKPEEVSPQESAKKIRQPVLVAHGTADTHIKFAYGKANFDKLASDQKIFLPIEGAVHHNVWQVGGKTYFEKVFSFLSSFHQMKYVLIYLAILSACQVTKEQTQNTDMAQLYNVWELHSLHGVDYSDEMTQKHPTLQIGAENKSVSGNDGCNTFFGSIEILTKTDLKFGILAGTKMMCEDMKITGAFGQALSKVEYYMLKELKLTLQDKDHNELMVLRKVD